MGLTGLGIENLGKAFGCSVLLHVAIVTVFLLMGSGDARGVEAKDGADAQKQEQTAAGGEEKPATDAAPVADNGGADAAPAAKETPKPETRKPDAKPRQKKPDAKPATPAQKKPDTRGKDGGKKPEQPRKPEASGTTEEAEPPAEVSGEWKEYEVRPGDSLTKLARKCGCTIQELAKVNGLKPTATLNLGQKIKIKAAE